MENKGTLFKILLVFCVVLIATLIGIFITVLKKAELAFNERKAILVKENLDLKQRFDSLQAEVSEKLATLESLQKEKELFEEKLSLVKKETSRIIESYVAQLDDLKKKNTSYRKKIALLGKSARNINSVQHIKEALTKEDNKDIKRVLEDTLNKIELIKSGKNVSLEPIVVTPVTSVSNEKIQSVKNGLVLSLDRVNNLIVVNMGRKDDLREGDLCRILLNGQAIAQSEIVSTRYNLSAAYVNQLQPKYTIDDIKEGLEVQILKR